MSLFWSKNALFWSEMYHMLSYSVVLYCTVFLLHCLVYILLPYGITCNCIVLFGILYYLFSNSMLLYFLLRRAGCVSQDVYSLNNIATRHRQEFSIAKNIARISKENSRSITRNPFSISRSCLDFLISTSFRGCTSHFRFEHFYIVDLHSALNLQVSVKRRVLFLTTSLWHA